MQQRASSRDTSNSALKAVNSAQKNSVTDKLVQFYSSFSVSSMAQIDTIYANHVVFKDPIHHVEGLNDLSEYFLSMMKRVSTCRFEFLEYNENSFYSWKMHFTHPKINKGKPVTVDGVSHIKVDKQQNLIVFQQDYYDMGAMLYEHLPVLGWTIDKLKKRMK